MIDLHTHLLPGVDDGSDTLEQSVGVLCDFMAKGVTGVCCTPHLRASDAESAPNAELERLLGRLRDVAPKGTTLARGYEIMLDTAEPPAFDRTLTLGGSRYVLVEFSRMVTAQASMAMLGRIVDRRYVPVLAHPERYHVCSPQMAQAWAACGAVLQLDATTLLRDTRRGRRARALLTSGCAGIIASDNHGDQRSLLEATEWLDSQGGSLQSHLLAFQNPRAILDDGDVVPVPALRIRRSWYSRLRSYVIGGSEA